MLSPAHDSRSTFERVYREQFVFVWRVLQAFGVHDSALDDAVQDVFIVAHRRLPEFEGRASVKTWLYEIARRVGTRYRTRAVRAAARHSELLELPGNDDLDGALDKASAANVLQDFLSGLDEDRRRAFVLAEFFEMPGREIAETLDVNMNTIYARLRSARTELDRVAHRLHAQDAGAVTRAIRKRRPSSEAKRRVLAGVLASATTPAVATATAGFGGGLVAWAVGAVAAGGLALAIAAPSSQPAPPQVDVQPATAAVATAGVDTPGATPPHAPRGAESITPPSRPSPTSPTESLPSSPPPPRGRAPSAERAPALTTAPLREQVTLVRSIRQALRQGNNDTARAKIAAYRGARGAEALEAEVDALAVELACREQSADARLQLRAFSLAHPGDAVLARLKTICEPKIAPQKPTAARTQPP